MYLDIGAACKGNMLIKNDNIRWPILLVIISTARPHCFAHKAINAARRNRADNARG
jgi:hypothetical protein